MSPTRTALLFACLTLTLSPLHASAQSQDQINVDLTAYDSQSEVDIQQDGSLLSVRWPFQSDHQGVLVLELQPGKPLIHEMAIEPTGSKERKSLLRDVEPVTYLRVGSRNLEPHGWIVFFDKTDRRPHELFRAKLDPKSVRVESHGRHSTVILDGLTAGPFSGDLRFTVYADCDLVHVQAVISTQRDACAILYDMGLVSESPSWQSIAYIDSHDQLHTVANNETATASPVDVRYRAIAAGGADGSVTVFPPPHQYLYPLDFADNFKFAWHGANYLQDEGTSGFGVRQPPEGDGRFVPWINAPPGSQQKLSVFYQLTEENPTEALKHAAAWTNSDRFRKLDGYRTFTSHYHVEHTLDYLQKQKEQHTTGVPAGLEEPPFVKTFKDRGVEIVHLAEFHVGHPPAFIADRLLHLQTLHSECRRLSDANFLLLPGEEPNVQLGGHWISLFPKPVYWRTHPKKEDPFEEHIDGVGAVYSPGSPQDMLRLMEKEGGLMWTAHPRIKSSFGYPDHYHQREFYLSDRFLGAAWKAMPADLSKDRLGTRCLDLLDDMANWGQQKYMLGEVDVFKVAPDYELYGHMNVNYLKLDALPRFDDGWQSVLDALRGGKFFVTTGEVLIPEFQINGAESGDTLEVDGPVNFSARVEYRFPIDFAEIVWGNGRDVNRQRIDLSDSEFASGKVTVQGEIQAPGATWIRLEAWDIATNGAFTQPVWLTRPRR